MIMWQWGGSILILSLIPHTMSAYAISGSIELHWQTPHEESLALFNRLGTFSAISGTKCYQKDSTEVFVKTLIN